MEATQPETIQRIHIAEIPHSPWVDFIGGDLALFHDLSEVPFPPYPLRPSALCCALCRRGSAHLRISLKEYEVKAGMMVVVHPEIIVQRMDSSDDFSALLIVISREFIDEIIPKAQLLYPVTLWAREQPCIPISNDEMDSFLRYHRFIGQRIKQDTGPFVREIIKGLLTALFFEVFSIYQRVMEEAQPMKKKTRKEELFERFMRAIAQLCRYERSVEGYAEQLCLSPKYLSTAVREVSGRTASSWIADFVILEAKALLKSTDKSIQQIAEELHFANQSFFGRYFKQHTGLSPKAYRG